jgi:hypothetical protein
MSANEPQSFSLSARVAKVFQGLRRTLTERAPSQDEMMRRFADNLMRQMRVALPARVVSFDASKQTIVAKPLIREKIIDRRTGKIQWLEIPNLLDVPVQFPQAGNFVLTMPIKAGDEVLVVFNDMCIDSWWASGGVQNWNDRRRHDLSDAIAIPGINSVPNVIPGISGNAAELRTKDGQSKVRLADDKITLLADNIHIHAREKLTYDCNGHGHIYRPTHIDSYTGGRTSTGHDISPPDID